MDTITIIILIILGVILLIGFIRLLIKAPGDMGDLLMQIFLLDWFGQFFSALFEVLGDVFDGDSGDDW